MKRRARLLEQVNVRLTEATAALLDDYVAELQRRMGDDDVVVQRVDALRIIVTRFLRKRDERSRAAVRKRPQRGRRSLAAR